MRHGEFQFDMGIKIRDTFSEASKYVHDTFINMQHYHRLLG